MADVTQSVNVFKQIRLVAGLRWLILRNSLRKKNNRLDLIGLIFTGLFASLLVIGLSFAFYAGAYAFLSQGRLEWMALLFWGIFLFWQVFPVFVAGFGANFEFRTLLRFPLSLRAFYAIGLAYGFADFSALASVCWLLAMTAGATAAKPGVLPAMLVIVAVFTLLNVTIERLIGSWLERLLARRRTREIFLGLFVLSMVSLNFIAPLMGRYGASARALFLRLQPYFAWLPPSLAGRALAAIIRLQPAGFLLSSALLILYLVLFSGFLWRRFAAQYRGEELSETAAPARAAIRTLQVKDDGPDRLSLLSPQVAAVVRKEFRYLTRNGFAYLSLLMPPLLILGIFSMNSAGWHLTKGGKGASTEIFFPGMMAYLILILMAPAYNSFAYEGRGIQTYFTAPLRFHEVLLGKNLILVSVLSLEIVLSMSMLLWLVGIPSAHRFVATCAAIIFTIVGQLTIANWSSITFPRKMEFGRVQGQRQSGMAALVAFGAQILMGTISAAVFFTGNWTGNLWLPAEAFIFLAAAAVGGYFASLDALSRLAEKKKEVLIEALCR
jgi:ABC-2 type transport system permease protein